MDLLADAAGRRVQSFVRRRGLVERTSFQRMMKCIDEEANPVKRAQAWRKRRRAGERYTELRRLCVGAVSISILSPWGHAPAHGLALQLRHASALCAIIEYSSRAIRKSP